MAINNSVFQSLVINPSSEPMKRSRLSRLRKREDIEPLEINEAVTDFHSENKINPFGNNKKQEESLQKSNSRPVDLIKQNDLLDPIGEFNSNENKLNTNQTQTKHKPNTENNTNQTQTKHKSNTKKNTKPIQTIEKTEYQHKGNTEANTISNTKQIQTEHKVNTNIRFSLLVGGQKLLVLFIYRECKHARSEITAELTLEYISDCLKIKIGSIKTSIGRLIDKLYIERAEFKNGRGGWVKYKIADVIYRELLQLETEGKINTNQTQTKHKPNTEANTENNTTTFSSSSSFKNLKETTTTEMEELKASQSTLSEEWLSIDTEPLRPINFGKPQLSQLAQQGKLTAEMVQDSIFAFAFDLNVNNKAKEIRTTPLNYLMGTLNKGIVYTCSNYESPQDKAMREYKEQKERALKKQQEMEEEICNLEFESWMLSFSEEAVLELIPEDIKRNDSFRKYGLESGYARSALKEHFKKTVWATVKNEVFPKIKYAASIDVQSSEDVSS